MANEGQGQGREAEDGSPMTLAARTEPCTARFVVVLVKPHVTSLGWKLRGTGSLVLHSSKNGALTFNEAPKRKLSRKPPPKIYPTGLPSRDPPTGVRLGGLLRRKQGRETWIHP